MDNEDHKKQIAKDLENVNNKDALELIHELVKRLQD